MKDGLVRGGSEQYAGSFKSNGPKMRGELQLQAMMSSACEKENRRKNEKKSSDGIWKKKSERREKEKGKGAEREKREGENEKKKN